MSLWGERVSGLWKRVAANEWKNNLASVMEVPECQAWQWSWKLRRISRSIKNLWKWEWGGKAWVLPWVLLLNLTMLLDICKWVNTLIICNLNFWLKFYMEYIGEKEQSGILWKSEKTISRGIFVFRDTKERHWEKLYGSNNTFLNIQVEIRSEKYPSQYICRDINW